MLKEYIKVKTAKKEYKDLTFAEVQRLVEFLEQGYDEIEAKQKVLDERVSN